MVLFEMVGEQLLLQAIPAPLRLSHAFCIERDISVAQVLPGIARLHLPMPYQKQPAQSLYLLTKAGLSSANGCQQQE